MSLSISKGVRPAPAKVVIYGHEGVGKSTLASKFPHPLFLDIEQGTKLLDVARIEEPVSSLSAFNAITAELTKDFPNGFETLVIDTGDWLDQLICDDVFGTKEQPTQVNDFGRSYVVLESKWSRVLDALTIIQSKHGVHVVVCAHANLRTVTNPEAVGSYDHWELKMSKKGGAKLKEWCDFLLFLHHKVIVTKDGMKSKAQGGQRSILTSHTSWADAKSRTDLPEEVVLTPNGAGEKLIIEKIACFQKQAPAPVPVVAQEPEVKDPPSNSPQDLGARPVIDEAQEKEALMIKVQDLMTLSGFTMADLELATAHPKISMRPKGTPLVKFSVSDLQRLVTGWEKVSKTIETVKAKQ